jgi:hypothetical protein
LIVALGRLIWPYSPVVLPLSTQTAPRSSTEVALPRARGAGVALATLIARHRRALTVPLEFLVGTGLT